MWTMTFLRRPWFARCEPDLRPGQKAPPIAIRTLEGKDFDLAQHRGKLVVVEFWATYCGGCVLSIPETLKTVELFKDKGVVALIIDSSETVDVAAAFLKKKAWPVAAACDTDKSLFKAYGAKGYPAMFLIGRDGVVKQTYGTYRTTLRLQR